MAKTITELYMEKDKRLAKRLAELDDYFDALREKEWEENKAQMTRSSALTPLKSYWPNMKNVSAN